MFRKQKPEAVRKSLNTTGIIVEYNPFHNGHLIHLNEAKKISGGVIAVMSGNFVQRGEPAICDKYSRAEMALRSGVSIVLELPARNAVASAPFFADAAVKILHHTGIVDSLCFGAETDDSALLAETASFLAYESKPFQASLKSFLNNGMSFAAARCAALARIMPEVAEMLKHPNNILAVEYIKALKLIKSTIRPFPVKRQGAGHDSSEMSGGTASASYIRKKILLGELDTLKTVMPSWCVNILQTEIDRGRAPNTLDSYSILLHYILSGKNFNRILKNDLISRDTEGILRRIHKSSAENFLISDVIDGAKTKRFAYTAIQRAVLRLILDAGEISADPAYIRVLGFRNDKRELLSRLVKNADLPVIVNLKNAGRLLDAKSLSLLEADLRAGEIYELGLRKTGSRPLNEASRPVVIV